MGPEYSFHYGPVSSVYEIIKDSLPSSFTTDDNYLMFVNSTQNLLSEIPHRELHSRLLCAVSLAGNKNVCCPLTSMV